MRQLDELFDYKNQLMSDILTNEKIIKLITDNETLRADPGRLVYEQVFPYEYVPVTMENADTFVCCDVDIQQSVNKTYLLPVLYIWEFTHMSRMRLPEGGVRVDALASEIAETINGSRLYGLGELELYSVRRFSPAEGFLGKILTFQARDFNRLSPSDKRIPANRKTG